MRYLIDTSSLISLARYYLEFENDRLVELFKAKFQSGEFILLDAVYVECKRTAKGIALEKLPFLLEKSFLKKYEIPENTEYLIPSKQKQFYHFVLNDFTNPSVRRSLSKGEFEILKEAFFKSADFKLILYAWNGKHKEEKHKCCIVTEETLAPNDHKLYRKIPKMCDLAGLDVINLRDLLKEFRMNVEVK
jgi:hypothetical protein